ncbi:MAG: hypothetical protein BWY06_03228 [Candidatus Latescibacteria bacterium ADurb.Bin168]|nr:MAG: hypothetical protein BWY06_03228 [Candidatus Latescibacteria bacterium ADurb.Bin168]
MVVDGLNGFGEFCASNRDARAPLQTTGIAPSSSEAVTISGAIPSTVSMRRSTVPESFPRANATVSNPSIWLANTSPSGAETLRKPLERIASSPPRMPAPLSTMSAHEPPSRCQKSSHASPRDGLGTKPPSTGNTYSGWRILYRTSAASRCDTSPFPVTSASVRLIVGRSRTRYFSISAASRPVRLPSPVTSP